MRKRKIIVLAFLIILLSIVTGTSLFRIFSKNKNDKYVESVSDGDVTRFEWVEMLCTQAGMTEYQNKTPYFSDINISNTYFPYIQSAFEWEILNNDSDFEGDGYASGRFIALTGIKSIGKSKLKIYLDTQNDITDDNCIKLALEHGLIQEEQLSKSFSKEECTQVLKRLKNLYFGVFWKDDYSEIKYQDGVIELSPDDVVQSSDDCSEIVVTDNIANSLDSGVIIVFEQKGTKIKVARRIVEINPGGNLLLGEVELDQVVESLTVSDITELTFEDIVNYYGLKENADTATNLKYQYANESIIDTSFFSIDVNSKGYKFSISTEEKDGKKHLEIQVTNNDTHVCYTLPIKPEVEAENEYSAEIDIENIHLGTQISYSVSGGGLEYVETAVDVSSTLKGGIKTDTDKKIPISTIPLPLGGGSVRADIQILLVLSANGEISLEAKLPVELSVYYEKGKGLRNFKPDFSFENPDVKANCKMGTMLRFEPILSILGCLNVIDLEADIGATATAETVSYPDLQVCTDISLAFPVITFSVSKDDDVDTVIKDIGLSAEWEFISSEKAPVQIGLHYEVLPDNTAQFVDNCTYKEIEEKTEDSSLETPDSDTSKHTYYTRYGEVMQTDSPIFCFEYSNNWSITKEEIHGDSTNFGPYAEEFVELSNGRGITITFVKVDSTLFEAGGMGHYFAEYSATKIAKAALAPLNNNTEIGSFVVAKLTETGSMITDADSDIIPSDSDYVSYALLSESIIDKYGGNLSANGASIGYYEMVSFDYPTPYVFCAESPDGQFTAEEEQEVIDILCSFRESD